MSKASALAVALKQPITPAPAATPASGKPEPVISPAVSQAADPKAKPAADPAVPAAVEPKATPEAEGLESTRFAALAKREAAIVAEKEKLKKEREEFAAKEAEWKKKLTPLEELEVKRAADPVAAMRDLGFSETDIINFLAGAKDLTPEEKAAAAAAKAAQEVIDKNRKADEEKAQKAQQDRDEALITRYRTDLKDTIEKKAEEFQYCAFYGAEEATEMAYKFTLRVLKDTGEMVSAEEAVKAVEEFYEKRELEKEGKIKKKAAPETPAIDPAAPAVPPPAAAKAKETAPEPPKTVTNAATPTLATTVNKKESRQEKRARLEAALRRQ